MDKSMQKYTENQEKHVKVALYLFWLLNTISDTTYISIKFEFYFFDQAEQFCWYLLRARIYLGQISSVFLPATFTIFC